MKTNYKLYLLTFMLFLTDMVVFAQPGGDGDNGLEGNDPPPAPINTKLIILLIFGLFLAFRYYKSFNAIKKS